MNKIHGASSAEANAELALYASIHALVMSARNTVARGVDLVQVRTNFEIGRHVVAHEQQGESRAEYGKEVLKRLAERLTAEFGRGFSVTNLKFMRQFYVLNIQRIGQTASDLLDEPNRAFAHGLTAQAAINSGLTTRHHLVRPSEIRMFRLFRLFGQLIAIHRPISTSPIASKMAHLSRMIRWIRSHPSNDQNADYLQSDEDCALYLQACIDEAPEDAALFTKAVGDIARARGMMQLARDTGLTREGFTRPWASKATPALQP